MKPERRSYYFSMGMLGALFFIFGLVSWVNSILVPYFKVVCELKSEVQGYLANFAFYIAYLVMTVPASGLLNRVGFKRGVQVGLWILGSGALLFVPAALSRTYDVFLVALFTCGTGLAILQTASNPFVTVIGPIESAARRISVMGICNKLAGILAPILFAASVIRPSDKAVIPVWMNVGDGRLVEKDSEQEEEHSQEDIGRIRPMSSWLCSSSCSESFSTSLPSPTFIQTGMTALRPARPRTGSPCSAIRTWSSGPSPCSATSDRRRSVSTLSWDMPKGWAWTCCRRKSFPPSRWAASLPDTS